MNTATFPGTKGVFMNSNVIQPCMGKDIYAANIRQSILLISIEICHFPTRTHIKQVLSDSSASEPSPRPPGPSSRRTPTARPCWTPTATPCWGATAWTWWRSCPRECSSTMNSFCPPTTPTTTARGTRTPANGAASSGTWSTGRSTSLWPAWPWPRRGRRSWTSWRRTLISPAFPSSSGNLSDQDHFSSSWKSSEWRLVTHDSPKCCRRHH